MKIAILGSAHATRKGIPWDDPEWTIFNLAWLPAQRTDVYFEIHHPSLWHEYIPLMMGGIPEYVRKLAAAKRPLFLREPHPEIPNAKVYPMDEMVKLLGTDQWRTSSISYLLAYAISLKPEKIGIWGVDMADDSEYTYQRWGAEYLIGFARGLGIDVYVPPESSLNRANFIYGSPYADGPQSMQGFTVDWLDNRRRGYVLDQDQSKAEFQFMLSRLYMLDGSISTLQKIPPELQKQALAQFISDHARLKEDHEKIAQKINMLSGAIQELDVQITYAKAFNRGEAIPSRILDPVKV